MFAVNTDGTGFTNVHSFNGSDGAGSTAALILSGSTLYGTTTSGGTLGGGTVFAVQTNGLDFTVLHSFTGSVDGLQPSAPLCLKDNTLYGTASGGGASDYGTVFAVNADGSGFTVLHSFTPLAFNPPGTNSDGANPIAGLILLGKTLYGAARFGGPAAYGNGGTLFAVNTDGTGFRLVHSFSGNAQDGNNPNKLLSLDNTLYGTATLGVSGLFGGTVFKVNTDGTGFAVLHAFNYPTDGGQPSAELLLLGNTLYGTSFCCGSSGGANGGGTVFSISLPPPQLAIIPSRSNILLTWPTNSAGFILQSTTNVDPPDWATHATAPIVINGQNIVTNPISGSQQFFRLSQ